MRLLMLLATALAVPLAVLPIGHVAAAGDVDAVAARARTALRLANANASADVAATSVNPGR